MRNHPHLDPRPEFWNYPLPRDMSATASKKRHRHTYSTTASSYSRPATAVIIDSDTENPRHPNPNPNPNPSSTPKSTSPSIRNSFNDHSSADVVLRLFVDPSPLDPSIAAPPAENDVVLHLHAHALRRCKYFDALLSGRWQQQSNPSPTVRNLTLKVPPAPNAMEARVSLLKLLYAPDLAAAITTVSTALDLLPVASELIFEDCVRSCLRFLEAVPWTPDEEARVLTLIPFLSEDEAEDLVARVSGAPNASEDMLFGLIQNAIHNPTMNSVKPFVAKLLKEFSSRDLAQRVLDRVFRSTFKDFKDSLEEYTSPGVRGNHLETEAIQRLNLHTAGTNVRHLVWIIERMLELRVADSAVREWSEQQAFTADLQRAFRDDMWKNIVPGLPAFLLRCTAKLLGAVADGSVLVAAQVRKKLVKDWLPVLVVCKDNNKEDRSGNHRLLYSELEETFLRIISTLPMSDAQELLQECLSFSTRNLDCPHLFKAFKTWFRRATHPPQAQS